MSGVKKLTQQTIKTINRKGKKITPSTKYKRTRDANCKGFLPCGQYQLVHFRRGEGAGISSATLGKCSSSWIEDTVISATDISGPSRSAVTTSVTWCIWLRLWVASNSVRFGCSLADAYTKLLLGVVDILHKESVKSTIVREVIEDFRSISW